MVDTLRLGGDGGNAFSFDQVGAQVSGKITNLEEVQQTDMTTGEPSFWPAGQPKMMYRVTLGTALRDPADPTDDGLRSVYLRGSTKPETQSSLAAVIGAVKTVTGGQDLRVGGTLTLQYIGDGQASQRGFNPPKLYAAAYQAPAVTLGQPAGQPQPNAWDGQQVQQAPQLAPQQQWTPPVAPPVQAAPPIQPPAPAPSAPSPALGQPETVAALAALGITPQQLAGLAAQNAAAVG